MTGKVSKIIRGMVCLDVEDGCRCWFEPLGGCNIKLGDEVAGNLWSLGGEVLVNKTRGATMSVYIQEYA